MLGSRVGIGEERGERCRLVFFPHSACGTRCCDSAGLRVCGCCVYCRKVVCEREREQHTPFVYAGRVEGFDAMAICGPYSWLCRRCLFVCVLARGVVHFYIYDAVAIA